LLNETEALTNAPRRRSMVKEDCGNLWLTSLSKLYASNLRRRSMVKEVCGNLWLTSLSKLYASNLR